MKRALLKSLLITLIFIWGVCLPFYWVFKFSETIDFDYMEALQYYLPELIASLFVVVVIFATLTNKIWTRWAALLTSLIIPILKYSIGSPTYGAWVIGSLLLVLLAWSTVIIHQKN